MSLDLLGIFGAGLATFVAPCVLPLVPIYLSALIGTDIRQASAAQRGQLLLRAVFFTIGFILVFTLLGLTASSIGNFLVTHKVVLQALGATLIMIFALKFLGVIQIPYLDRTMQVDDRKLKTRSGVINALIMGVVFAAGWSPCAGPVLGSVLTYTASTTSDPLTGALYLTVYGLGFALPLLLVAIFAEAGVKLLQKIGPHLPKIERVVGVLLVLVAGSLLFSLSADSASASVCGELAMDSEGSPQPTMLIFTSENCSVCQQMHPLLTRMKTECHGKKVFIREYDVSKQEDKAVGSKYRLVATPSFVFLDSSGDEVARLIGEQTENTLKQALSALRGEPCPGIRFVDDSGDPKAPGASCNTASEEPGECTGPARQ